MLINQATIFEFQGEYRWLSNFWPCTVKVLGVKYPSAENAYVAMKTEDIGLREVISEIKNPGAVKRFGRTLIIRPDWDHLKLVFMREIINAKFGQNPDLMQKLLDTNDIIIEEGNRWNDRFWGICPPASGNGENHLGKILMETRNSWRSHGHYCRSRR